jgi:hypothetical protein
MLVPCQQPRVRSKEDSDASPRFSNEDGLLPDCKCRQYEVRVLQVFANFASERKTAQHELWTSERSKLELALLRAMEPLFRLSGAPPRIAQAITMATPQYSPLTTRLLLSWSTEKETPSAKTLITLIHQYVIMGKGQLLFKGEKPKKKKNKSKHSSSSKESKDVESSASPAAAPSATVAAQSAVAAAPAVASPSMKTGTGKITTSGTVVTGHDTRFEKELNAGDAILCTLENGKEELRVITMRLSNRSLNLSSAFSINVKVPTSFQYIRKPRDIHKERSDAQKQKAETMHEQKTHAFDLYGNEALVYREKTETGSYRIKHEKLESNRGSNTRGDLLQLRAKKTSDKFC